MNIKVIGANENNLKNISVEIPRDRLVVVTECFWFRKIVISF